MVHCQPYISCCFTSPLPTMVYFPAIPTLTQVFHETAESINLTLTVFLVPMALFGKPPLLCDSLSDKWGRRPWILASFIILIASSVGLALVPTNTFWLLILLRFVQSAGCSGIFALGAGIIADITVRENRGGFFGVFITSYMVGPCVGPVIGGFLAQYLGWRSIFWFLAISSTVSVVLILVFLPETLPCIVWDGHLSQLFVYRPWINVFKGKTQEGLSPVDIPSPKHSTIHFGCLYTRMCSLAFSSEVYHLPYNIAFQERWQAHTNLTIRFSMVAMLVSAIWQVEQDCSLPHFQTENYSILIIVELARNLHAKLRRRACQSKVPIIARIFHWNMCDSRGLPISLSCIWRA
ncbi:major facilitator superfamily domain-containing protein [Desarmillaria tabescens]|uniref:Major facilitator superfamily domain-containing protein n=1 Tax=Armillaria tabescens TaxID=1929756 RepID=A0AA39NPL5_ARMTA|nr:major facilitator superfamily domain-containing protein [Desarmillaria tabescens]KAK0469324.1 major facilitator superfamily domain-containing protein [Desarmillaria tabescens]